MSDLVHQVSGLPRLDAGNPNQVYETIMDPDLTLNYVAAALKKISEAKAPFASRGDNSGTHKAELRLWRDAGVDPKQVVIGSLRRQSGREVETTPAELQSPQHE